MKRKSRAKIMLPDIKKLITERALNTDIARNTLAEELINEIKEQFPNEIPPQFETLIKMISAVRNHESSPLDKPWNTATLVDKPINPDAIPWLIATQSDMKDNYSKPLTIREALWYSRLIGFKNTIKAIDSIDKDEQLNPLFRRNIIAEWAHLYAYRELIDDNAKIKERDYSDLDNQVSRLDFKPAYKYFQNKMMDNIVSFTSDNKFEHITKEKFEYWMDKNLLPQVTEQIRRVESIVLNHSLGDPNLDRGAVVIYHDMLNIINSNTGYQEQLLKISYPDRIIFFRILRQACNGKTEELKNKNLYEYMAQIFKFIKEDSE